MEQEKRKTARQRMKQMGKETDVKKKERKTATGEKIRCRQQRIKKKLPADIGNRKVRST